MSSVQLLQDHIWEECFRAVDVMSVDVSAAARLSAPSRAREPVDHDHALALRPLDKQRWTVERPLARRPRKPSNLRYRIAEQTNGHAELERALVLSGRVLKVHEQKRARHRILASVVRILRAPRPGPLPPGRGCGCGWTCGCVTVPARMAGARDPPPDAS